MSITDQQLHEAASKLAQKKAKIYLNENPDSSPLDAFAQGLVDGMALGIEFCTQQESKRKAAARDEAERIDSLPK